MAQIQKGGSSSSRQEPKSYDVAVLSDVEACDNFIPNQWRRTLCQNCFRGYSAHVIQERPPPKWYFAKIEGPFTWEQMRHWYEAGYFSQGPILLQQVDESKGEKVDTTGKEFRNLEELFTDKDLAFIPRDEAKRAKEVGIDAAAAGMRIGAIVLVTAILASVLAFENAGNLLDTETVNKQINPSTLRAYSEEMELYLSRGDEWYFIDASNERQGPFSSKQMSSWYKAGYFWNKDLMLSHAGWQQYVTLLEMMEAASELYNEMSHAAVDNEEQSDQTVSEVSLDSVGEGEQIGQTRSEVVGQAGTVETSQHNGSPTPLSSDGVANTASTQAGQNSHDADDETASAGSDDEPEWYYIDDSGVVQGPFSTVQMLDWYDNDFLPRDIPIKHTQPEFKYFVPLNRLFDDETVFDYPENWAHIYQKAIEEGNYRTGPSP